jgi:hypothetical protein
MAPRHGFSGGAKAAITGGKRRKRATQQPSPMEVPPMSDRYTPLFEPKTLVRIPHRDDITGIAPDEPGLYGFWFEPKALPGVSAKGCITKDGFALMNLGIAKNNRTCTSNLRKRLSSHYGARGGHTPLRQKLESLTGLTGDALTAWLETHARVSFVEVPEPYKENRALIRQGVFPLN